MDIYTCYLLFHTKECQSLSTAMEGQISLILKSEKYRLSWQPFIWFDSARTPIHVFTEFKCINEHPNKQIWVSYYPWDSALVIQGREHGSLSILSQQMSSSFICVVKVRNLGDKLCFPLSRLSHVIPSAVTSACFPHISRTLPLHLFWSQPPSYTAGTIAGTFLGSHSGPFF